MWNPRKTFARCRYDFLWTQYPRSAFTRRKSSDLLRSEILEVLLGNSEPYTIGTVISPEDQRAQLEKLANTRMPFGKFEGRYLVHLPEPYLVWYRQKGFPKGTLGEQLQLMLEIKVNGLEELIYPLIKK